MDTNIDLLDTVTRLAVLCRGIRQKLHYYHHNAIVSVDCVVRLLQMGKSTTQRSTRPNLSKYATRMPVSIISKGQLKPERQILHVMEMAAPKSAHASPGQR